MIKTQGLSFKYKDNNSQNLFVLNNINIDITSGQYIAILGENGSGKSTLAKHFNVLLLPSKGKVYVDGLLSKDASNLWKIRDKVSMVFQNPNNQIVGTTVEEDMAFGMENREFPQHMMRARISKYLKLVSLVNQKRQNPISLSGGQKQKLAIAGTLITKPDYIILDEATAMLDAASRKEVMHTVRTICNDTKTTVINITHFVEEALHADYVYVMSSGKIVMQGNPRQIFSHPDDLKKYHLEVPMVTQVGYDLKKLGYPLEMPILSIKELCTQLKMMRSN